MGAPSHSGRDPSNRRSAAARSPSAMVLFAYSRTCAAPSVISCCFTLDFCENCIASFPVFYEFLHMQEEKVGTHIEILYPSCKCFFLVSRLSSSDARSGISSRVVVWVCVNAPTKPRSPVPLFERHPFLDLGLECVCVCVCVCVCFVFAYNQYAVSVVHK